MTATITSTSTSTSTNPSTATSTSTGTGQASGTVGQLGRTGSRTPARRRRTGRPQPRTDTSRPPAGAPPALESWVKTDRRLVLIDIENIVGGSEATAAEVAEALEALRDTIGTGEHDVWLIACGPSLLATAMSVLPKNVLMGRGIDGADLRLVEHMDPAAVAGRFRSVALASADTQAFRAAVALLAEAGVPTDLYIGAGHLGHALARIARSITEVRPRRSHAA